jgi:hypothetical protein
MRERKPRCFVLAGLFVFGLVVFGTQDRAQALPAGGESFGAICEPGTVASYIGTTCALPPAVYRWISYSCTSTPSSICARLGRNGSEIHMRRDPNGPNTLLLGDTQLWNVSAGQSVDIVIRGSVYGATGNLTWPHFYAQRAQTGDGTEENITTVFCGENCISGEGVSAFRCTSTDPEENCIDQRRIGPYRKGVARFRATGPDSPYPFSIEIKLNGGTSGTASLRSLGLHISAIPEGAGHFGQGPRRP